MAEARARRGDEDEGMKIEMVADIRQYLEWEVQQGGPSRAPAVLFLAQAGASPSPRRAVALLAPLRRAPLLGAAHTGAQEHRPPAHMPYY
jgi:hypothetical protein